MAITSIQTTIDVQKSRVTILFRYYEHQLLLKSKSMLQLTTSYAQSKSLQTQTPQHSLSMSHLNCIVNNLISNHNHAP